LSPDLVRVLERGVQTFADLLGSAWTVRRLQNMEADRGADAVVDATPDGPSPYARFLVDVKNKVTPRFAEDVLLPKNALIKQLDGRTTLMVMAAWIGPRTQRVLRDHGISYLDLTGNAWIRVSQPAIAIYTQGASRQPSDVASASSRTTLAGARAGRLVRLLADVSPPYRAAQLAECAGVSLSYVSKLLDHLEDQLLIRRDGRVVVDVDWPELLRSRAATVDLLRHNASVGMLAPNGIAPVLSALQDVAARIAITGSYAARAVAPRTSGGQLMIYVAHGAESIGDHLGLLRVDEAADVLLLQAKDEVVFERTRVIDGISHVALSQLVIDGLSGPGRLPAEGEAVLNYMIEHQRWRAASLEAIRG
jgi:hypothetical protein